MKLNRHLQSADARIITELPKFNYCKCVHGCMNVKPCTGAFEFLCTMILIRL